jgi:rhamnosyltransferase
MQYAIGIVTYQPDITRLQENLQAAAENLQGGPILLVDNGSQNIADIQSLTDNIGNVTLMRNSNNLGIAAALNQLCRQAQELGCEWMVTLDQDSVIQSGMLQEFCNYTDQSDVAIICPRIEDRRLGRQHTRLTSGTEYVSHAITAGNMVRLKAWQAVQGFTEELFIDGVDFDFCLKLREAGWQILRTNNVCLYQEMGHGRKIALPFHHQMSVLNHSPQRLYYIARNYLWIGRRHHQRLHWSLEVAKRLFIVLCFERQKWQKLRAMFTGICHSFKF